MLVLVLSGCGPPSVEPTAPDGFADVSVTLPEDRTLLPPGPNHELATANCTACHSAEMITHQPRLTRAQWEANVEKMVSVYKANIAPADVAPIVDYLVTVNTRLTPAVRSAPPPRPEP